MIFNLNRYFSYYFFIILFELILFELILFELILFELFTIFINFQCSKQIFLFFNFKFYF